MSSATIVWAEPAVEQAAGQHLHRLRGGALAHPDEDGAVADDQDVAALDGGRVVVLPLGPVVEGARLGAGEQGVVAVDRLEVDGLALPGRPAHRVDGHPVVYPGRGVPGEEVVRQRVQQEVVQVHDVEADGGRLTVARQELPLGHAADERVGQLRAGQLLEGGPQMLGGERSVLLLLEDPVQDEPSGHRDVQRLTEQIAEEVHLHTAVAQHVREAVVLLAGPADPEHVVEEERVLVAGGEPLQFQIRAVQDDAAQPPGLGVDVESHVSILTVRGPVNPANRQWVFR